MAGRGVGHAHAHLWYNVNCDKWMLKGAFTPSAMGSSATLGTRDWPVGEVKPRVYGGSKWHDATARVEEVP